MLPALELLPDLVRVVDADDDNVSVRCAVERSPGRLELVGDGFHAPCPGVAGGHRLLHAIRDESRCLASLAPARVLVLAGDDLVEEA